MKPIIHDIWVVKEKILFIHLSIILVLGMVSHQSCTHDPGMININDGMDPDTLLPDTFIPDTIPTDIVDTPDTTRNGNDQHPCDPDTVYFEADILPFLQSNCALSGCHNAASAQKDVILESYTSVINSNIVEAFNLDESDLYEVLTEDDEDKRMPPPPANRLLDNQVALIAKWIQQGAKNVQCDDDGSDGCNVADVSYTETVKPVIDTYCISCHSGPEASGGINLGNYNNLKMMVDNGRFYGAISWAEGYKKMPQGGSQLAPCILEGIKKWIDEGAQNN